MKPIQKILFPVDFSSSCVAMAPHVKRAASITGARVSLLHVVDFRASGFELYVRPMPEVRRDLETCARDQLSTFLDSEFPPGEYPRLMRTGDAATVIAGLARQEGFGMIVMPTHAGVFRRTLLGSTTAKVLDDADCPVFTTQHAETITPREIGHREWVCAIGLSAGSERVLCYATELAETFHANVTLVHVIPLTEQVPAAQLDLEERVQCSERHAARDRLFELQRTVGSHARVKIAVGPIKDGLTEAARTLQADAVVIGRSARPGSEGRLRDLTYAVVRDAPCPVVSI